ncbi:ADP-ribosylation/crystallin J1 [Taklimakanibacter deserti]|uniref:ADP-ribosylation/crystallin J1 n=1 Tax=Taklimakanibacter deserti TaxID=2267839 RepID=UPI0034D448D7
MTTLYRPVGTKELELIAASGFRRFPPRLPEQPIFYPVTNEEYAVQIARDWNTRHNADKKGYVTRFALPTDYLARFDRKVVGGALHEELWVPAAELDEFNTNIVGAIEIIHRFDGVAQ